MKGMQKYELKGVVGEGAYGKVFMARNKETGEVGKLNTLADESCHKLTCWLLSHSCNKEIQRIG